MNQAHLTKLDLQLLLPSQTLSSLAQGEKAFEPLTFMGKNKTKTAQMKTGNFPKVEFN